LINPDISYYIDCLLAINSQSTLGLLAKALSEYEQKNYAAAKNILIRVNELQPNWGVCLKLLLHVYELLKSYSSAEIVYRQLKIFDLKFIECLAEQNKKEKSDEILKIAGQLLEREVDAVEQKKIDFVLTK
jgi:tetratricopeptide (TPR) repeat protein